jgi:hypothetical protein
MDHLAADTRRAIEEAAARYDSANYPECVYADHLAVLAGATKATPELARAVKYLFLWKLGKIKQKETGKGFPLSYADDDGGQYWATRPPGASVKAIELATQAQKLQHGLAFRDGAVSFEAFRLIAQGITKGSIVLPAFSVHVWRPSEYPILDVNVWCVFCHERGRPVTKNTKPHSWHDYDDYRRFFRQKVNSTGLDWRTVDRGLWVLGDRLKQNLDGTNGLPHERWARREGKIRPSGRCLPCPRPMVVGSPPPPAPTHILDDVCRLVSGSATFAPYKCRGIPITRELVRTAMEILNAAPDRLLPQNCCNAKKENTEDGLDRRIKEKLQTGTRTANIISDVLADVGVVDVLKVRKPRTGRKIKATRLRQAWAW